MAGALRRKLVRVIAGRVGSVKGAVDTGATEPTYLDVHLPAGASFTQPVPHDHNAFVYVYDGTATVDDGSNDRGGQSPPLRHSEIGVLSKGDAITVTAGDAPARLILVAGKPLGEPIARHGPFVMNSMTEIRQAVEDFTSGKF